MFVADNFSLAAEAYAIRQVYERLWAETEGVPTGLQSSRRPGKA
jgi:hypothetical protein